VAYLQHASARTGLWKSVVAPRRWTYRCGTVLPMSIKWRWQPPKGGCIIIAPGWLLPGVSSGRRIYRRRAVV